MTLTSLEIVEAAAPIDCQSSGKVESFPSSLKFNFVAFLSAYAVGNSTRVGFLQLSPLTLNAFLKVAGSCKNLS